MEIEYSVTNRQHVKITQRVSERSTNELIMLDRRHWVCLCVTVIKPISMNLITFLRSRRLRTMATATGKYVLFYLILVYFQKE